jgi:subtilase family serine protease
MPSYADGTRVNVYVNGIFAVNCLVPPGNANSTVDVTLIRN